MALAFLKYRGRDKMGHKFLADIGSSKFYRFKIGKYRQKWGGMERLEGIVYESPLQPQDTSFQQRLRTDFSLQIPAHLFKENAKYIQLFSFKDSALKAPAISEVLKIPPIIRQRSGELFPELSLTAFESTAMEKFEVGSKSFCYKEPPITRAMFWDKIIGALPKIVDTALPFVKKMIGGGGKGSNGNAATGVKSDEILNAIAELLKNLTNKQELAKASSVPSMSEDMAINPAMLTQLAPLLQKVMSPETINAIGNQPVKLFKAIGDAVLKIDKQEMEHLERLNPGVDDPTIVPILNSMSLGTPRYSTAKIAPALLAALPALMPVIEKALDPKMIEAIGNQPIKLFKAIGDAALKLDQQEMQHLERLNPGVDDPTILPILNSMSVVNNIGKQGLNFRTHPKIELKFEETQLIELNGKKKVIYTKKNPITIPIKVFSTDTNAPKRPIPRVIVQLFIQDGDSMKVLFEKKYKLKEISLGQTIYDLTIEEEELLALPINKDLKVEVSVIWKGSKSKRNVGTFKNHYITLIDEYSFNKMGAETGETLALNDLVQYRGFWHKVWEGGYSDSRRWEIDFDVKYYYVIDLDEPAPSRLSTKKKVISDNAEGQGSAPHKRKVHAKLKSGMEVTLGMLNKLLHTLGPDPLPEEKLKALRTEELQKYFNQTARVNLELKGKRGDTGTLWVYPEISIHQLELLKAAQVNKWGMVSQTETEIVQFPRPSSIHFIGTKSK